MTARRVADPYVRSGLFGVHRQFLNDTCVELRLAVVVFQRDLLFGLVVAFCMPSQFRLCRGGFYSFKGEQHELF